MTIRIVRERSIPPGVTHGVVFVDDRYFGWSLEDEIREVPGQPVARWKVAGQTAIPAGTYPVAVTFSPRFQRLLPEVGNVPGFSSIRIHPGNRVNDTEGCLLIGYGRKPGAIEQSRVACDELQAQMDASMKRGERVWLVVENPLSAP